MAYPVSIRLEPHLADKNRVTTAFRIFLAIPHAILVVGPVVRPSDHANSPGLMSSAAYFLAIVNWFAILFTGRELKGIRDFSLYYLRWRTRAIAYMALFVDKYPPFGDEPYPASIEVVEPGVPRDLFSVGFRLILALPQLIVLAFLLIAWIILTIVAWFAVLFTGSYPASIYSFTSGSMRWGLRVEAYVLLLVDDYPPFSLE
jgi:hypothetical protein